MTDTQNILFKSSTAIHPDSKIEIRIPRVGEILDYGEEEYYRICQALTAMPMDCMVQLDDAGIDFTKINEYELFFMLFPSIQNSDTSLVFRNLDPSGFIVDRNPKNGEYILRHKENGVIIDRLVYTQIAATIRKIHHWEQNLKKPADEGTRQYLIERARKKMKRKKQYKSQLEALIIALVNTEQCKYNFEGIRELSIYQFNECVRQIIKKIDYDNRMFGVYTGNISTKNLDQKDLIWFTQN